MSWSFFLGRLSLTISRYALDQGAAALAVDVEETADYRNSRGANSAIRLFRHHELRRSERGLSKEDPTGNAYFSQAPIAMH